MGLGISKVSGRGKNRPQRCARRSPVQLRSSTVAAALYQNLPPANPWTNSKACAVLLTTPLTVFIPCPFFRSSIQPPQSPSRHPTSTSPLPLPPPPETYPATLPNTTPTPPPPPSPFPHHVHSPHKVPSLPRRPRAQGLLFLHSTPQTSRQ